MKVEFFLPMENPPTITQQEHQIRVVHGKPVFYEPAELRHTRQLFMDSVARYAPDQPLLGPVQLLTKWIWLGSGNPAYKTTKPDTDNLIKLFKDCLTRVGFWNDDAQVASEITEKFFGPVPGIYVRIIQLGASELEGEAAWGGQWGSQSLIRSLTD